jgi:hypothetical protein
MSPDEVGGIVLIILNAKTGYGNLFLADLWQI